MGSKVALVAAMTLLSAIAVHGCGSYCQPPAVVLTPPIAVPPPRYVQPPVVVPTPPIAVPPPPYSGGGGHSHSGQCSIDVLKLRVCANVLGGLLGLINVGIPAYDECCPLLRGLVDLDAAVCLCTAVEANVLDIVHLNVPLDITLLLNHCGKTCPSDFTCSAH